jgi:transcriptional regulator with XRE-family HTH domain
MNDNRVFGAYLKLKRNEKKKSVREFAAEIGVSPGYYGDIESARRTPVDLDFLSKVIMLLNLSGEEERKLYDLAGKDRSMAPPDLTDYINENKIVRDALRAAKKKANDGDWLTFINSLK